MEKKYDLIVIGAGPGGYTAAIKAASLGMKVAVIEREKLGGTCVNKGCIPTKALLHASNLFSMFQKCDQFGVSADFIAFDFAKMQEYKKKSVKQYRNEIAASFEKHRIDFLRGTACLRRNKTVEVRGKDGKDYYEADHILIATGASAVIPDIPGSRLPGVLTSDRLLGAENWNFDRLTIIGGGVIGVEFASLFGALCSSVTIIEREPCLLGPMDEETSEALKKVLESRGITIYCRAKVKEIREEDGLICQVDTEAGQVSVRSGQVLLAVGRTPCLEGLCGPDVTLKTEEGRLKVNAEFMTSEPEVYAVGDVLAGVQLAHVAAAQAVYVVEQMAGIRHRIKLESVPSGMFVRLPIVPSCIYTEPEIASVGITRETAKVYRMKVVCGRYDMAANGKSIINMEKTGFIHLIFEAYSMALVGAQMVCERATDMIGEMATAIANGLTARQLSLAMRAHPTYSEGISAAIEDAMKQGEAGYEM